MGPIPATFGLFSIFLNILTAKAKDFSWIQTGIVGFEGEHTDH